MAETNGTKPNSRKQQKLTRARRAILLASTAALGGILLVAGPGGYVPLSLPASLSTARAAVLTGEHPASFADLVAKVKPAVISVRVKIDESQNLTSMNQSGDNNAIPFAPGSPMEKFFQQFGFGNPPNGMMQRRAIITGEGSGFFISPDGYAVTNNHVVDHAKSVQVRTDDGATYTAKVIGTDPRTDLCPDQSRWQERFPL
jgi:serine protease Do